MKSFQKIPRIKLTEIISIIQEESIKYLQFVFTTSVKASPIFNGSTTACDTGHAENTN